MQEQAAEQLRKNQTGLFLPIVDRRAAGLSWNNSGSKNGVVFQRPMLEWITQLLPFDEENENIHVGGINIFVVLGQSKEKTNEPL